jgi:hypothetical protein
MGGRKALAVAVHVRRQRQEGLHAGAGCSYTNGSYQPLISAMGGRKALADAVRASGR